MLERVTDPFEEGLDYRRRTVSEGSAEGKRRRSSDFYCFSEWSQHFIYADPESNIMGKRKTKEQQDKATLPKSPRKWRSRGSQCLRESIATLFERKF
jgi:hypothetical protein